MHQQLNLTLCLITAFDNTIHIPIMFWCFGKQKLLLWTGPLYNKSPAQLCRQRNDHKPQDRQKVSLQRARALNRNRITGEWSKVSELSAFCHRRSTRHTNQPMLWYAFVTNPTSQVTAEHQATSPKRPWHRIPSYEVKNLRGQHEQLAGQ